MTNVDYGTMPIGKLIRKLAIPSIITMIVGSINMVIDGIFMGNFIGSSALAAVNLVMPVMMMMFGLIGMVASGAGIRIGVLLGEGKQTEASRVFSASTVMIFAIGIFISVISSFFVKDLISALVKDEHLALLSYDYVKVMIPAIPLIAPLFAFDNFLLICGKVNRSTWINVWTSLLNILLNWYFIVYLGLGISFAALATTIGMVVGSILSILPFVKSKLDLKFTTPKIPFKDVKLIIYNGSSDFFQSIAGSVMAVFTNGIMLSVAGATGVAAMSVISYIEMLLFPVLMGVIGSVQPVVSYNFGAKNHERVKETFRKVCTISAVISAISFGTMILFPDFLISLFANESDAEMINIALTGLLLFAPSYLFNWFNILVGTFLSAFEKPKESMILMLLDSLIFPVIFFIALSIFMGVNGIFLAQTVSAGSAFLVSISMWKKASADFK